MATPTLVYAAARERHAVALAALLAAPATPQTVDGRTYTTTNLGELYAMLDWLAVKGAIEAIESGLQAYSIDGRTFSRADYSDLIERERSLRPSLPTDVAPNTRTGIRVRQIVAGS